MSNYLALRSSAAPTLTVSTLLAKSITFQSTMISLGQSTNQSNNFSGGSFTTGWASTLTGLTSIKKVVLSPNGSVQTILQNSGSTMSTTITSLNSGITWAGSTMRGLPTSGALPYQTYGSTINAMTVPSITAITAAPSSGNQLAITSNELVYSSANSGATFAPTGLGQNNNPFIYLPFDGSVTDVMGNTTATVTGSIAYVPGKVGTNAVNLANTAGSAGNTASNYIRYTVPSNMTSFTISGWFNSQTTVTTGYPTIISMYSVGIYLILAPVANQPPQLFFAFPSGSGNGQNGIQTTCGIAMNTWYSFTIVYQIGTCSLYVNGALVGTGSSTGLGTFTGSTLGLGCYDNNTNQPFSGYIDDFRLYNYAVTNPSGAALINPIVGPIMPFVYVTFDGSTTTDLMGNSTTTATGSPGFVAGQVGSNAINFANTAGVAATRYVTGTWTGATNFTISLWLNYQTAPLSTTQVAMSLRSSGTPLFDIGHNTSSGFVQFYYGAGIVQFMSLGTLSINTWYRVTFVYQQGGTSSAYLNEQLITSLANSPALQVSPTTFELGSRLTGSLAFNGYIDDLRIYNSAFLPSQLSPVLYSPSHAIGSPNIYLPFENGSVLDTMGYSAISARGTMNFVPGVVGSSALNLVNPAGGNAVNFLRGSWAGSPNFTVSFWFNVQALGVTQQVLFSAYAGNYVIYLNSSGQILIYLPSGGSALNALTSPAISVNTWYYVTAIFQTNGTCALYLNNTLAGTYTNSGGVGSNTTVAFGIATYDINLLSAFNGYIDDFKLYNCAIPFNALGPMNYTQAYLSNTGAYQVVAAANGGVYTSANSGSSWSQATTSPQVAAAVNTVGGQVITPQLTGLAANTWTQNGVNWVASASSVFSVLYAYGAFNNYVGSAGTYSWGSLNNTYSTSSPFACTSGVSTTILGIGATVGEWLQIQTSIPLVIQSYSYTCGGAVNIPQRYYIVGSNDGSAWYPIQLAVMTTNPFTANFQVASTYITVNQSGIQTIIGAQTGSGSFTTYPTTTNAYTYFRILATNVFGTGSLFEFGELYINFATPPTPLYVAPSTALIANQSVSAITVMPQQTGLTGGATTTWTTNGISWVASSSSNLGASFVAYYAFNGISASSGLNFASASAYNTANGAYTGSNSTTVVGITPAVTGEWLQIQSSVPLVLTSYTYGSANWLGLPKTGYWVGSNDGTTWYPLQSWSMTTNPLNSAWATCSTYLTMNYTGTQTIIGNVAGSGTFMSYSYTTQAYQYFRMIGQTLYVGDAYYEMSELYLNFTAYTPSLLQSLTVSPTGQYMALTGSGATAPNLTGVAANTWTANGVTWTASASSTIPNANYAPYAIFNNSYANVNPLGWADFGSSYNSSTGAYVGLVSTTIQDIVPPATGVWIQIQSSIPLVLHSYRFATAVTAANIPKTYYLVGSNDGSTWYALHYASLTTNPTTTPHTTCSTNLLVNFTGTQTIQGNQTGSGSTTSYSTSTTPFTYFRLILSAIWPSNASVSEIGELYLNFQSGPTFYSTDYGSNWTRSLSAATIPNANVLATSGNGQYSLQASGQTVLIAINTFGGYPTGNYTTPTFSPALTNTIGPVSNAAVSATGQYMVVLIQSTTNNVYYSTNYGVSFTGLMLGSSAMVSCAISADGTYMTVASSTQVYTLNWNTQGFTVSLGNSAGAVNQGQNAIAIGNQAGAINQSAGSIILNSSGSAVNSYFPGFFVSPIALAGSSVSGSFAVLGYGTDNQVVQSSSLFIGANGNVGVGTANPSATLHVNGSITSSGSINGNGNVNSVGVLALYDAPTPANGFLRITTASGTNYIQSGLTATVDSKADIVFGSIYASSEWMRIRSNGNVGIGSMAPSAMVDLFRLSADRASCLNIKSNQAGIYLDSTPGGGHTWNIWSGYTTSGDPANLNFYNQTRGAFVLCLQNSTGNVGINITNPTSTLHVNGSLSKSSGTFDITHPLYPNTAKRLVHSFIEGPRCDLIYRGKTTLVDGFAVVNIDKECTHSPECAMDEGTFEVLCDNPQIFLQNNKSFDRVCGVISGATLTITCENPTTVEIEWMVIAERADPFIKQWDRTNPDGYLITQYTTENSANAEPSN